MARPRYRAIVKKACEECALSIQMKRKLDTKCNKCSFLRYNNVNNLLTFTAYLHKDHPNWVWFNLFEYKKGEQGRKLASFQKGKNEPHNPSL